MAFFSMHAYDADVWIPQFRGLNQADVGLNPDTRFAAEAWNVETPNGVLQPQAAPVLMDGEFNSRVETLAVLHRRWYTGSGSRNWYVCAAGGKFYQKQEGSGIGWDEIDLPEGVDAFESSVWSYVTYEYNQPTEGEPVTLDVLLISNAKDGMFMIVPPERPTTWYMVSDSTWGGLSSKTWAEVHSEKWTIKSVDTDGKKFGVIERYAERIWGTGVPGEPDTLYYSVPYDPTDWTINQQIPEDGAGEIQQPSWDGDQFHALKRFGDHLLAFKKNRVWRVLGVSPGEFTVQEQFGGGTEYFNTIAVYKQRAFMADVNGLLIFDGQSTSSYAREQVEQLWRTVNRNAMDQMCGCFFNDKYYFAFPVGDSPVNNGMLVYNMNEGTILYYKDIQIESFLPTDDVLFATSSDLPGRILKVQYDSWVAGEARNASTKWVSPWMDFGYKRIQKGGFELYILPEVQTEPVTFTISIQTEKKCKTKQYTCNPLTEEQLAVPKEHRAKRIHFGGSGRKFRIILETEASSAPWRLIGGIQMVVETDPD